MPVSLITPWGRAMRAPGSKASMGPAVAVQQADQNVLNSTTLVNSTDLSLPIAANKTYYFRAVLMINNPGTTAGVKLALTGPASPTAVMLNGLLENSTSGLLHQSVNGFATIIAGGIATTGIKYAILEGTVVNGVNAGSLAIQFAQNAVDAVNNTTLKAASVLFVQQLN